MTDREFDGKVAFITGAAHGQGRATALALARAGARITAFDIAKPLAYPGYDLGSPSDLQSLQTACRDVGSDCLTHEGDVRDDAAITAAVDRTLAGFGRIDILFNNAGIAAYGSPTNSQKTNGTPCSTSTSKVPGSSPAVSSPS